MLNLGTNKYKLSNNISELFPGIIIFLPTGCVVLLWTSYITANFKYAVSCWLFSGFGLKSRDLRVLVACVLNVQATYHYYFSPNICNISHFSLRPNCNLFFLFFFFKLWHHKQGVLHYSVAMSACSCLVFWPSVIQFSFFGSFPVSHCQLRDRKAVCSVGPHLVVWCFKN